MHSCKAEKELLLLSLKFQASGFCFLASCILYLIRVSFHLLLFRHNMGLRFCQRIPQFCVHPFSMQFAHLFLQLLQLVTQCFNQCLSHREGGLCPSLRGLNQALGTGRMCQELSFKLALQICPCCVTATVSPAAAVPRTTSGHQTYSCPTSPCLFTVFSGCLYSR